MPPRYRKELKNEVAFRFRVPTVHPGWLVVHAKCRMSTLEHRPVMNQPMPDSDYQIIAQSAGDVQNIENAPAVSMGPYLLKSGQIRLLTTISIYSLRGESREQVRLLYINAAALQVWQEMG